MRVKGGGLLEGVMVGIWLDSVRSIVTTPHAEGRMMRLSPLPVTMGVLGGGEGYGSG